MITPDLLPCQRDCYARECQATVLRYVICEETYVHISLDDTPWVLATSWQFLGSAGLLVLCSAMTIQGGQMHADATPCQRRGATMGVSS